MTIHLVLLGGFFGAQFLDQNGRHLQRDIVTLIRVLGTKWQQCWQNFSGTGSDGLLWQYF